MKKSVAAVLAAAIILTAGVVAIVSQNDTPAPTTSNTTNQTEASHIGVEQKIADGPSQSLEAHPGDTALALLQQTATIKADGEGANAFVTEINGRMADAAKNEFWALYVNGAQAQVGAGSYILQAGDKIEWRIETF